MTDDLNEDDADFYSRAPTRHLHELYFPPLDLEGDEKAAAILENRKELRERANKHYNPIDALNYQLAALNVMFHDSTFESCSHRDMLHLKHALTAQKLYRETVSFIVKNQKR